MQGFTHQTDIALRQITHTTMHQFGRTRRGAFGKVVGFEQDHFVASLAGLQRHTQSCCTAANHRQIKALRDGQLLKKFRAGHR